MPRNGDGWLVGTPRGLSTRLLRLPSDAQTSELRKTLQDIARAHGTRPQRQAATLLTAAVTKLAGTCGGLRGERDRALILLGFAGAFRRSELVKIQPCSKADQHGEGSIVHLLTSSRPQPACPHCPVVAVVETDLHARWRRCVEQLTCPKCTTAPAGQRPQS